GLDPIFAETFAVMTDDAVAFAPFGSADEAVLHRIDPSLAAGHDIVIGQLQEVVAMGMVPIGGDFGELIPIGPQGVGVQVSLPPKVPVAGGGGFRLIAELVIGGALCGGVGSQKE